MSSKDLLFSIFELAKEYRLDPYLTIKENFQKDIAILTKLSKILPKFSFEKYLQKFQIIDSRQKIKRGKSNDLVYFVYDQDNCFKYVLKGFLYPFHLQSKFLRELSALNLIESLASKFIQPIQVFDVGTATVEGKPYGLILETVAQGIRMDQFSEMDESAFYFLGRALGSLRPHISQKPSKLPKEQILQLKEIAVKKAGIDQLIEEASSVPIQLCYLHGDANLGNVFYNQSDSLITFVDTFKMHASVDKYLNPLKEGSEDLFRVEDFIQRKAKPYISSEKIQNWIDSLFKGYCEENQMPHPAIAKFYRTFFEIKRAKSSESIG